MTLDLGASDERNVFYLNFEKIGVLDFQGERKDQPDLGLFGTEIVPNDQFCEAEQNFNFDALIENGSNWLLSIERLRLPLQGIPMLDGDEKEPAIELIKTDDDNVFSRLFLPDIFSLNEFLEALNPNTFLGYWTVDFAGTDHAPRFNLTPDGRICIGGDLDQWVLKLRPDIASIFDLPLIIGGYGSPVTELRGATPLFDRFDQLYKIEVVAQSGLSNIQQEIVNTRVFRNVLTDFLVPSSWSMSYSKDSAGGPATGFRYIDCSSAHDPAYSLGYPIRQDLEFNDASNRRWIFIRGSAPIQNVKIECLATMRTGVTRRIRLTPRSVFSAKVAFWNKT